jgi:outer membrane protein assembly factor BamB
MPIALRQTAAARVARGPIVLSGPFVSDTSLFTGQTTDFALKLDKQTLKEVWRKKQMASIRSCHLDSILVFVGKKNEMQLWESGGKIVWTRRGNQYAFDDRLYFAEDSKLHVVDVITGRTIDEFESPGGNALFERDGTLLLGEREDSPGVVSAVDLAGRRVIWEQDLRAKIQEQFGDACPRGLAFVASRTGSVVVKTGEHLVGVSLANGSVEWGLRLAVPYLAPKAADSRMYIWSAPTPTDNRLTIVNEATGAIDVDRPLSEYGPAFQRVQQVYGGTICRNHVIFTSNSGLMALFRLTDGELVWQHEYQTHLFSPIFRDNRLYMATAAGDIVIFEAHGGEL